jgi:phage terminase small subunit
MNDVDPRIHFEPAPSQKQVAVWDMFIEEYVKDYNGVQAAIRIGFNVTYAQEYARVFLGTPYVAKKIAEYKTQVGSALDNDKLKQMIEQKYIEIMNSGDPKAAAAAAKQLAQMRGIDGAPDKAGDQLKALVDAFKEVAVNTPD